MYYTYWNIYSKMILCLEHAFKNYISLVLTNHYKLGGLEQQFIVFTILEAKSKIRIFSALVPPEVYEGDSVPTLLIFGNSGIVGL